MNHCIPPGLAGLLLAVSFVAPPVVAGDALESSRWTLVDDEKSGAREQHLLVYSPALKKTLLLAGTTAPGTSYVMAFDPVGKTWEALSDARPNVGKALPGTAVCDADGRNVFVLAGHQVHKFDVMAGTWSVQGEPLTNSSLTALTLAFDPVNNGLVLLGSETALDKVGWMGGVFRGLADGKWQPLAFGDEAARQAHDQRREVWTALNELVGRTRHAWYRDPQGEGSDGERKDLGDRCGMLKKHPGLGKLSGDVDKVSGLIGQKNLLEALKSARVLQRKFEEAMEAASPVPPARRHSPVVCDPVNKVLVLFGGDHDDYTTSDTWVLDLVKRRWRRANPKIAPGPRAGHGLAWLPKSGKIALWDGFRHNSSTDYRSFQAALLPQREVWLYDVASDKWELAASWPVSEKSLPFRKGMMGMGFFGYTSQPFPMALAADAADRLVFVGGGTKKQDKAVLNGTWLLGVDARRTDAEAAAKQGGAPNNRAERTGPFLAAFCEDPAPATPAGIENLPANVWTQLPQPPRHPYFGWRKCDFGTAAWNPDVDEILHWGGGHCDSSTSVVTHRSLISNRAVLAYDLDEPYGSNGGGPWPGSLMGRPWVGTHAYRSYGYDYRSKVMVLLRNGVGSVSRLYDPVGMRWLAEAPRQPFDGHDYTAHVIPTPRGAVAWAGTREYMGSAGRGLWILDRQDAWTWKELAKPGSAPSCHVDNSCSVYDSKRDRILLMPGRDEGGTIHACSLKDGVFEKLTPGNPGFGRVYRKEAVYVEHTDWVLLLQTIEHDGKASHIVYDCEKNQWMLFDGGPLTAKMPSPGRGLMYDARRKLVYLMTEDGVLFALRIDPKEARIVDKE